MVVGVNSDVVVINRHKLAQLMEWAKKGIEADQAALFSGIDEIDQPACMNNIIDFDVTGERSE